MVVVVAMVAVVTTVADAAGGRAVVDVRAALAEEAELLPVGCVCV